MTINTITIAINADTVESVLDVDPAPAFTSTFSLSVVEIEVVVTTDPMLIFVRIRRLIFVSLDSLHGHIQLDPRVVILFLLHVDLYLNEGHKTQFFVIFPQIVLTKKPCKTLIFISVKE